MSAKDVMTADVLAKVQQTFNDFDDDNDGEIEVQKIESALRAYGLNPTIDEVSDILEDMNRSNTINMNTFAYIVYHLSRCSDVEKELIDAFRLFDKNATGKIPKSMVKQILTNIKRPFTDSQIDEVLNKLQDDKENIDYTSLAKELLVL